MVLPVACLSAGLLGRPRRRDTLGPFLHGAFVIQRQNWSRRLPRPLLIPDVMMLATLADVRTLMQHLPADRRELSTWRQVSADIEAAAAGGDIEGAIIVLRMVLFLERVECRPM